MHSIQTILARVGGDVTSTAQVVVAAPCHYYGMMVNRDPAASGCTVAISDSSSSGSTGTIKDWVRSYHSGTSVAGSFVSTKSEVGVKIADGLRVQAMGLASGNTVIIYYG